MFRMYEKIFISGSHKSSFHLKIDNSARLMERPVLGCHVAGKLRLRPVVVSHHTAQHIIFIHKRRQAEDGTGDTAGNSAGSFF